jgi:hypothetical protein
MADHRSGMDAVGPETVFLQLARGRGKTHVVNCRHLCTDTPIPSLHVWLARTFWTGPMANFEEVICGTGMGVHSGRESRPRDRNLR